MQLWERPTAFAESLRDLPKSFSPSSMTAGLVAALMGVTGPTLLVYDAAVQSGYPTEAIVSWFFAVYVGGGLMGLILTLAYRQPIAGAWSIAGAALLVETLPRLGLHEAVGAYLISGGMITALALTGWFEWLMRKIPREIVLGMLAGVLLPFGAGIFRQMSGDPLLVGLTVGAYALSHRAMKRVPPITVALVAGVLVTLWLGETQWQSLTLEAAWPALYHPVFSWDGFFSLSLPLALLMLSSQNATGIGVLSLEGYRPPTHGITLLTGVFSLLAAPFAGHGVNLAAPMTAICADRAAHDDPGSRYSAAVVANVVYGFFGVVSMSMVAVIRILPMALIRTIGGLALLPVIANALKHSLGNGAYRYGAIFALIITTSRVEWLGIGSAFWGLVGGMVFSVAMDSEWTEA